MAVNFIMGPREHHNVKSPDEYRAAQAKFVAQKAAQGARYAVHVEEAPVVARVDHNSWVIDCECGAGNAVDPDWPEACCFGCGAIHTHIVWPENRTRIEQLLLARPNAGDRTWYPRESEDDLVRENASIGVQS